MNFRANGYVKEPNRCSIVDGNNNYEYSHFIEHTKNFAMLVRRKSAGVNVDVRVDLDGCDSDAICFKDCSDAAGDDAFPDAAYHTSSHQNVLHCRGYEFVAKLKEGSLQGNSTLPASLPSLEMREMG